MIRTEEYYKTNNPTVANSKEFDLTLEKKSIFPSEGIYIGEFESVSGHKAPALIPLEQTNGLCFLTNSENKELIHKTMQSIALRLVLSLPFGLCKLTLYDGTSSGANLISLANLSSKIIGENILTDPDELKLALNATQTNIPNIIQKVLGHKHLGKSLIDYNKDAGELTKPYHFLFITDFPKSLTKEHGESIEKIIKSGKQAGVFVIMSLDTSYQVKNNYDYNPMSILDNITTIYESGNRYYIKNLPNEKFYNTFRLSLDRNFLDHKTLDKVLDEIKNKEFEKQAPKSISLVDYLPEKQKWWNKSSIDSLEIPFGLTPESDTVSLSITQTSGQNVAVVVGIPGSGKSVFLNSIITSTTIYYSPDEVELYLIDFSGVEFSTYGDYALPHAKVIAPESEREFGISVLRRLKEEGNRRMGLFRKAGVNNIVDYRRKNPNEKMPRILIIVDEFQKFFENEMDKISEEAETIIQIIVQEYRKFGINLILATQSIHKYINKIEMGMIANRVAFEWKPDDAHYLFVGSDPSYLISDPGDCVYNKKSGKPTSNIQTKAFNVSQSELKPMLENLQILSKEQNKQAEQQIIFRSESLAIIDTNEELKKVEKKEIPNIVRVFLGEPIEISDTHAYFELEKISNSNILVVGGEQKVAQRIAINCAKSLLAAHEDNKATFYFFDFMQSHEEFYGKPKELYKDIPFNYEFVKTDKQLEYLEKIKEIIEQRQSDSLTKKRHIFLSFYAFQLAHAFKKQGEWGDMSDLGKLLDFILEQGSLVGVFIILQVDELGSLSKSLDKALDKFNHRVVLQMSEDNSRIVTDTAIASRIYVENKPSSINRAYYYNKNKNTLTKFKPYEI